MLDGHEVSETERQFLMNWKAMRKARRKHQKRSLEQIPYVVNDTLPSSHPVFISSAPAPPPTLPALPARQLPHRCKKLIHQEPTSSNQFQNNLPTLTKEMTNAVDFGDFKLPELAPYQSIITQQGHLTSALSNQQLPRERTWRTMEVAAGNAVGQVL